MKIVLERPQVRDTAISMLADGATYPEVADSVAHKGQTVTYQAVALFAQKHAQEIEARRNTRALALAAETDGEWITDKSQRVRRLEALAERVEGLLDENLMLTETRTYGTSDKPEVVETKRFNGSMIRELRGILRDAAEELGQIPRSADVNVTNNLVLIRQYNGDTEGIQMLDTLTRYAYRLRHPHAYATLRRRLHI